MKARRKAAWPVSSTSAVKIAILIAATATAETSYAQSALLFGASAGPSVVRSSDHVIAARFRVGAAIDWLHHAGPLVVTRLELGHTLDASAALLGGWSGSGLRRGHGSPFGAAAGLVVARSERGFASVGGRTMLIVSLWYDRAALELDLTARKPLGRQAPRGLELSGALVLRVVPWSPLEL